MKTKVALIFGGRSVEHEVSIISGLQALSWFDLTKYDPIPIYLAKDNTMWIGDNISDIKAYTNTPKLLESSTNVIFTSNNNETKLIPLKGLNYKNKLGTPIHIIFPVVHGSNVEDGTLQGFARMLNIPFVGCNIDASAIGMDKYFTKTILKAANIPVLEGKAFHADTYSITDIVKETEQKLNYPVIVKPNNLGSSVGVSIAHNTNELFDAINNSFMYTNDILIERAVTNLREINCAVLGDNEKAIASECEEPIVTEILSYEDKYTSNSKSKGMASTSRIIPPNLSKDKLKYIKQIAIKAFQTLKCCGVARIDFILDKDKIYFNEINTIPGSLSFYLWEPTGITTTELIDKMIQLALRRHRLNNDLQFTFDTNILENANFSGTKK